MSFPRYSDYRDSGAAWLGEVPQYWDVVPMKYLARFQSGGTPSKENESFWNGVVPWASAKDMKVDYLFDTEDHITDDAVESNAASLLDPGAVLVVVRGMILARAFPVAVTRARMSINQDLKAIVPLGRVLPEFFALYLRGTADESLRRLDEAGHGTKALRMDAWTSLVIAFPTLAEQERIVAFLDRETGKIDALVTEQEMLIELLTEQRQAVISHAVTRGLDPAVPMKDSGFEWLGKVPVHWETGPLKRFVVLTTSGPRGWSDLISETGAAFFQSQNIGYSMEVLLGQSTRINPPSDADAERARLKGDDVVVCITGGRTGAVAHIPQNIEEAYVNQHVCLLRPSARILGRFLAYCLFSIPSQEQFYCAMYGLKQGMGLDQVRRTVITCPDIEEQREIIAFLDAKIATLDALVGEARRAIGLLTERRAALISAAVTGRIDVRGLVVAEAVEAA